MRIFALELDNDIKGLLPRQEYIEQLIAQLEQPQLVVLPELAMCSYMGSDEIWQYADEAGQQAIDFARKMALRYHTYIALGFLERQGGHFYNSYLIADGSQVYGIVRKSEGESYIFRRGAFPNIIETPFGHVAVGICYDAHRRHLYDNICNSPVSLILFPHGSPCDPQLLEREREINDQLCGAYLRAFDVPVVYVNSTGRLDFMLGRTGKMMQDAGFRLCGCSKIYSNRGDVLQSSLPQAVGLAVELEDKQRREDIRFYGQDIRRGNFLFRKLVLPQDIRAGIRYYEQHRKQAAEHASGEDKQTSS